MNSEEFKRWFGFHKSRFTGVESWLAKFPESSLIEDAITRRSVLAGWYDTLVDAEFRDAREATQMLFSGAERFSNDAGYDHHPRDVRRIAGEVRTRRAKSSRRRFGIDGEPTYDCRFCRDSGLVEIVHPKTVALARTQPHSFLDNATLYSGMAACTCAAGDRWHANSGCVRYHEGVMPLLSELSRGNGEVPQGSLASFVRAALGDNPQRRSARGDHTQTLQFEEKCRLIEWLEAHCVTSGQGQAWNPDASDFT